MVAGKGHSNLRFFHSIFSIFKLDVYHFQTFPNLTFVISELDVRQYFPFPNLIFKVLQQHQNGKDYPYELKILMECSKKSCSISSSKVREHHS